ncbi:hypothetical protein H696_05938 [Fonticula alba]|uniref:Uncharacterized protein n=1 Tax=Fonticula alba TaxID=691883 RepID=A0A058Z0J3_FONAL|nr:hypothetical protein H696_05938 [Fonticula alba]KCV67651.1 hypothetical protein H696_05938 [Fonticula alba]|eukprot:XP_009497989.1 hypothetical protein H696_05938 [Fonticula alba]
MSGFRPLQTIRDFFLPRPMAPMRTGDDEASGASPPISPRAEALQYQQPYQQQQQQQQQQQAFMQQVPTGHAYNGRGPGAGGAPDSDPHLHGLRPKTVEHRHVRDAVEPYDGYQPLRGSGNSSGSGPSKPIPAAGPPTLQQQQQQQQMNDGGRAAMAGSQAAAAAAAAAAARQQQNYPGQFHDTMADTKTINGVAFTDKDLAALHRAMKKDLPRNQLNDRERLPSPHAFQPPQSTFLPKGTDVMRSNNQFLGQATLAHPKPPRLPESP